MSENLLGPVFLSYSHADATFVGRFDTDLRDRGYQTWLDEKDLVPGDAVVETIGRALNSAKAVIVVISDASHGRPWLRYELNVATTRMINGQCRVIPVLISGHTVPTIIEQLHYADFRKNWSLGFAKVISALEKEQVSIRDRRVASLLSSDAIERFRAARQVLSEELGPHKYREWDLDEIRSIEYECYDVRFDRGSATIVYHELVPTIDAKRLSAADFEDFQDLVAGDLLESYGLLVTARPLVKSFADALFKLPIPNLYYALNPKKHSAGLLAAILDLSTPVEERILRLIVHHLSSLVIGEERNKLNSDVSRIL